MSNPWESFTRKELRAMSIEDLRTLATYYGVMHTPNMNKAALLRALIPLPAQTQEPPRYSVRVARLMQLREESEEHGR